MFKVAHPMMMAIAPYPPQTIPPSPSPPSFDDVNPKWW
ncbi:hypothetical protein A2U01_0066402 [Trifolium medium]|uniref:Uncharacterized protein n=1 Tax=Trifolium medium TaxID=97028 RepID=A0A392S895_9FABA|nr:hypothetical protein [Trifolium medium]